MRASIVLGLLLLTSFARAQSLGPPGPLEISDLSEGPYSYVGGESVHIWGVGFTPQSTATVAGIAATLQYQSLEEIDVILPPFPDAVTGEPVALVVTDPVTGSDSETIIYWADFTVAGVDPVFVPVGRTTIVDVFGTALHPGTIVRIGGEPGVVTFVDHTHLRVEVPLLDAGIYDVEVTAYAPGIREQVVLRGQLSYFSGPPEISHVEPSVLCSSESTFVTVHGTGFLPVTQLWINDDLMSRALVHQEGTRITVIVPPRPAGPLVVRVEDARGLDSDRTVFASSDDCPTRQCPQQIEASLAEDRVRVTWFNPEAYTSIEVYDTNMELVAILPGTATRYESTVPPGTAQIGYHVGGFVESEYSALARVLAKIQVCEYPPPLEGAVEPSALSLTVRGGALGDPVVRCSDGSGPIGPQPAGQFGVYTDLASPGSVVPDWIAPLFDTERLVTGFVLDEPAERLDLSVFYAKLAPAFGLSLRARIRQVFPDTGFEDEITLPDPFAGEERQWHSVTYYRATDDLGANPSASPCLEASGDRKLIPAGEYVLEIYAVGGILGLPYYAVASDPRDDQLFIEGTPCPPYPLVRVRDVSGFRTLPNVTSIEVESAHEAGNGVRAVLSARGTWVDDAGMTWSIDPFCDSLETVTIIGESFPGSGIGLGDWLICGDPEYREPPLYEYCWTIRATEPAICRVDRGSQGALLTTTLPDWGCYPVELTITDLACGTSRTFFKEVAIFPDSGDLCDPTEPAYTFKYPTPDPKSVYVIANMSSPTPGSGAFQGTRPLDTRVLVVPRCYCEGTSCPAPLIDGEVSDSSDDIQFRLAVRNSSGTYISLGADVRVQDLCPDEPGGPKYFRVFVPDLSQIAYSPFLDDFEFRPVYLQARSNCYRLSPTFCQTISPPDDWDNVGQPIHMANHPAILDQFPWEAYFDEETATYHFTVTPTLDPEQPFPLPDSEAVDFGIVDSGIPSYSGNQVRAGFVTRFSMQGGQWIGGNGTSSSSGKLLGNLVNGSALTLEPTPFSISSFGGVDSIGYEWCRHEKIFEQEFNQTLFESIIYAGFVGPVPVNIWGSVGLGVRFVIDSYLETRVSPFTPIPGTGNYLEMQYTLDSELEVSVPCQISADILGGIASLAIALRPEASFRFQPYVLAGVGATPFIADYYLATFLSLYMEIEACIQTLVLGEQCLPKISIPLIEDLPIMDGHGTDQTPVSCHGASASAVAGSPSPAFGGPPGGTSYGAVSQPESITSPDQTTVVDIWVSADGSEKLVNIHITENGEEVGFYVSAPPSGFFFDPVATFVNNDTVILAGTSLAPGYLGASPPEDPDDPDYLTARNQNVAHTEVQIAVLQKVGAGWQLDLEALPQLSDPEMTPAVDRRADGAPAISGDTSTGEALVAWVRYQDDYLIDEGQTFLYMPFFEACGQAFCGVQSPVDDIRMQMEATSIVVRRVDPLGALPGSMIEIISEPGINIQPSISYSPSGDHAYCVWLHDPVHTDLISSNQGRFLKYSRYDAATGVWSLPVDVVAFPDDYPGILDPVIMLSGDDEGLVAFTAIEPGRTAIDAGLTGRSRFLYTCRLEGGVFDDPIEIRGACNEKVYGWKPAFSLPPPEVFIPLPGSKLLNPDWVIFWQEFGGIGTPAGSGNIVVSTLMEGATEWSPPVRLLEAGERIVSNVSATVAGGVLHTTHFDAGAATLDLSSGAFSGPPVPLGYRTSTRAMAPDLAVSRLRLSHPFGPPGTRVEGTVTVDNRGLASSVVNFSDQSLVSVEVVGVAANGSETVMATLPIDRLDPGTETRVPFVIETPHDPVRLEVRLLGNVLDRDPSNDRASRLLGAPAPTDFSCAVTESLDALGETQYAVELTWTNPSLYDQLFLYRQGQLLHRLPGNATCFIDSGRSTIPRNYTIRGMIGASRSSRTRVDCLPPAPGFVRGDANGDGTTDISDAIRALDYLFVFGPDLPCLAAADVTADGSVDVADAVNLLVFLFQFGPPPAPPFPDCAPSELQTDLDLGCDDAGC